MKRTTGKRSVLGTTRGLNLKKPFNFCCDAKDQDPETRYNENNPPFKSSMANIFLNGGGPGLKFRIQDIGRSPHPIRREGRRIIGTLLGECNRCRGPLKWYIEDEISLARDMLAYDKQTKYSSDVEKHVKIAIKKAKKRWEYRRKEKQKMVK